MVLEKKALRVYHHQKQTALHSMAILSPPPPLPCCVGALPFKCWRETWQQQAACESHQQPSAAGKPVSSYPWPP